jgi:altronate hydrolase
VPYPETIKLREADNVLVLPRGGTRGDAVGDFKLLDDVPPGHKTACALIREKEPVVKYGHVIGVAKRDIPVGEWVHEHNVSTRLGGDMDVFPAWTPKTLNCLPPKTPGEEKYFYGYPRANGRPGVRNDIWVIPAVGCINGELRSIVAGYGKPLWIDSVKILEHPYGCSQLGGDLEMTRRILAGLANNPNAAGVLLVGLGCENLRVEDLLESVLKTRDASLVRCLALQDSSEGNVKEYLSELAEAAPKERKKCGVRELCVGVKCGGSDGCSGLSANPLTGRFSDWLTSRGGTILATEIPEMFGAEDVIAGRVLQAPVYDEFKALDKWFREYFVRYGQPIYENPSPGNREGGITTLEEKSLGAVEKMGSSPVTAVLGYGEAVSAAGGVQITFAPGNDLVSCTSLAGSGAQMMLFTTGRGTPFGTVVPTIKISTNTALARRHPDWIDFNAGILLEGASWETASKKLIDCVLSVASGQLTAHEKKNIGEIAIFKDGATL